MEENKCRQEAWRVVEEKKHTSLEEEKNKMVDMIKNQQELIDKLMEKIELWDEKELTGEDFERKMITTKTPHKIHWWKTITLNKWITMPARSQSPLEPNCE